MTPHPPQPDEYSKGVYRCQGCGVPFTEATVLCPACREAEALRVRPVSVGLTVAAAGALAYLAYLLLT